MKLFIPRKSHYELIESNNFVLTKAITEIVRIAFDFVLLISRNDNINNTSINLILP